MVSSGNEKCTDDIQEVSGEAITSSNYGTKEHVLYVSTSQRELLDEKRQSKKCLGMLTSHPGRFSFMKFGSTSQSTPTSSKFRRIGDERGDSSHSVNSLMDRSSRHFHVPFVRKINWISLWKLSKEWIRNPINMALFLWITCVGISGAILFLVMTGMLNGAIPRKSQRDTWFEVNNQIINALFTLMCLYQHPKRFYHLALLYRWRPDDVLKLRNIYCKNGTQKPNEWKHMMVVVILLHVNCFAQYALCGLNLGYRRSNRPAIGVAICLSVAISAPAIASVYNILSPLGKEYETEIKTDQESQSQIGSTPDHLRIEKRYSFMTREEHGVAESNPQWVGGLFDLWDDISLAYLSVFCSCCVFGWNMDRLGFGNMYVHIVTFLLFCLAPFFIFNLAAVNLDNETIREALGLTGFVLCIFGLLYGGFWRIQMRKKFNLPPNNFCGKPEVTDCLQWLCCCSCSLAQEVRTADYYDIVEDKFYLKEISSETGDGLSPLPPEIGSGLSSSRPVSSFQGNISDSIFNVENSKNPFRTAGAFSSDLPSSVAGKESSERVNDDPTKSPVMPVMHKG
ncbi:uncharacterized protein [Typha angustifolia]|uniref:uncharacterized protein n=1 Tax=Typha angustifolia TaxID=59011 RepID=UPI003C3003BB